MRTMATEGELHDQMYLRLDADLYGFSKEQCLSCAGEFDKYLHSFADNRFILRMEDSNCHSIKKSSFSDVLMRELNESPAELQTGGISFCGFLKTESMRTKKEMSRPFALNNDILQAYTIGEKPMVLKPPTPLPYETLLNNHVARREFFHQLAAFSQLDKQWLSTFSSWDIAGSFAVAFSVSPDGEKRAIGDASLLFSCHMLENDISAVYEQLKALALQMNAMIPFVHLAIGFGPILPETYETVSATDDNSRMEDYTYMQSYGSVLGWYNLIPQQWSERLSKKIPLEIRKETLINGSDAFEMEGTVTPYRAKDFLKMRKYLSPILRPMGRSMVEYTLYSPHIMPFEANELELDRGRNGRAKVIYVVCPGDGSADTF